MAKKVPFIGCTLKHLPEDQIEGAAVMACAYNPANEPTRAALKFAVESETPTKLALAVMTSKWWKPGGVDLTVGFMETVTAAFRERLLTHFNAAGAFANIKARWTQTSPQVRVGFANDGYWSYLGTDILTVPKSKPTLNLQGFTMNTPESEWVRVTRHEWLHTCGCPHEHSRGAIVNRLDPEKVIAEFKRSQGWSEDEIRQQILTPIPESQLIAGEAEEESIMAYWFPGTVTKNGKPILGGKDFSEKDKTFLAKIYPPITPPTPPSAATITLSQAMLAGTYSLK